MQKGTCPSTFSPPSACSPAVTNFRLLNSAAVSFHTRKITSAATTTTAKSYIHESSMEAKEINRTRKSPRAREREYWGSSIETQQDTDGDGNTGNGSRGEGLDAPKLYHTLTACTRCRSVRSLLPVLEPKFLLIIGSGKPVVMQGYRSVGRANEVGRIVNSSIQQSKRPYQGTMWFIYRPKFGR